MISPDISVTSTREISACVCQPAPESNCSSDMSVPRTREATSASLGRLGYQIYPLTFDSPMGGYRCVYTKNSDGMPAINTMATMKPLALQNYPGPYRIYESELVLLTCRLTAGC